LLNRALLRLKRWADIQHTTVFKQIHAFMQPGNLSIHLLKSHHLIDKQHQQGGAEAQLHPLQPVETIGAEGTIPLWRWPVVAKEVAHGRTGHLSASIVPQGSPSGGRRLGGLLDRPLGFSPSCWPRGAANKRGKAVPLAIGFSHGVDPPPDVASPTAFPRGSGLARDVPPVRAAPVAPLSAEGPVPPGVLVALGAVPGAWIRCWMVSGGGQWLPQRHWATWLVNMLACLLLGLLVGLRSHWGKATQDTLQLALAIGFLGGLSTYSTLIAELVTAWRRHGFPSALRLGTASLLGGLLTCLLGLTLARGWR
jgi:CrcB protein